MISIARRFLPQALKNGIGRLLAEVLAERQFTRPYIKRKCVEGVCFDFYIGDADGMAWYDTKCTDPFWPEMRVIKEHLLSRGDVALDVGAHHGCSTVLFSKWVGTEGRVVAIEPNPHNVSILRTNVEINALSNVEIVNAAVGESKGTLRLSMESSNSRLSRGNDPSAIPVEVIALDSLGGLQPSFIKLDVEGADVLALRGAKAVLATRPKLAIEVHKDNLCEFSTSMDEFLSLIDFDAYDCWIQWNYEKEIGRWENSGHSSRMADVRRMVHGTHIFAKPKAGS